MIRSAARPPFANQHASFEFPHFDTRLFQPPAVLTMKDRASVVDCIASGN